MPEPFKNLFNKKVITSMGKALSDAWPDFNHRDFTKKATKNLHALELKERSDRITEALATYLPDDFDKAASIMLDSLATDVDGDISDMTTNNQGIAGWCIMPMTHYVGLYGLEHFDLSMTLFKEMTKRFSSEFGIRFFLLAEPKRTFSTLKTWINDPNYHVRRLISEGTRPRLPWGMRLPNFIHDPSPVLSLLEDLKDDKEEYVRRSVANNLNDIAKDHPDIVAKTAKKWLKGANTNRKKLVFHGCRTLIKQGHQKTLKILGYGKPSVQFEKLDILTPCVDFGTSLRFEMALHSTSTHNQNLIIDYAIYHRKANGKTSPKVFKWKTIVLEPSSTLKAKKSHAIKKITTRTYYPGRHYLEILVNGESIVRKEFDLIM